MKKQVVIDLDGTLFDIHREVDKVVQAKGYPNYGINRVLTYDFNKSLDISAPNAWDVVSSAEEGVGEYFLNAPRAVIFDALSDVGIFERAEVFGGDATIKALKRLMNTEKVFVTFYSISFTEEIAEVKRKRLWKLFGDCEEHWEYKAQLGGDLKSAICADFVVEDNVRAAESYSFLKTCKFCCVRRPYNNPENDLTLKHSSKLDSVSFFDSVEDTLNYIAERV